MSTAPVPAPESILQLFLSDRERVSPEADTALFVRRVQRWRSEALLFKDKDAQALYAQLQDERDTLYSLLRQAAAAASPSLPPAEPDPSYDPPQMLRAVQLRILFLTEQVRLLSAPAPAATPQTRIGPDDV